jgi:hypothetical protein
MPVEFDSREIVREINRLTTDLVATGLLDDQNWPTVRTHQGTDYVSVPTSVGSAVLKYKSYTSLYSEVREGRAFNLLFLDGAMLQMDYEFRGSQIIRHRLSFLPSPDLLEYQTAPDTYFDEQLFADIVGPQVHPVALRLDFDDREGVAQNILHPTSHMTLGQYNNCRIPITGPVSPGIFLDFIVRSFYWVPSVSTPVTIGDTIFASGSTITADERKVLHVALP